MQARHIRPGDRVLTHAGWVTAASVDPNMDGHVEVVTPGGRAFIFRATDDVQRLTCSVERTSGPWDDFPPAGKAPAEWGIR